MQSCDFYIGIMSGTSLDGIDIALVTFKQNKTKLIDSVTVPYQHKTKEKIDTLVNSRECSLHLLCEVDRQIATEYTSAVLELLKINNLEPQQIKAIGCHGQTIKHSPNNDIPYTFQIGDPNTLAALSGITTVADFRRKDIALGGQGAPLTPAFHQHAFQDKEKNRLIINIGGITNVTILPKENSPLEIIGFDTGPGNTLMDHFFQMNFQQPYDKSGDLAKQGKILKPLIDHILKSETYFELPPPKSTGTDYFNLAWFDSFNPNLIDSNKPIDLLATLNELTAITIASAINKLPISVDEIYFCGGGIHNTTLVKSIKKHTGINYFSTEKLGVQPDYLEAIAFAWFAKNTLEGKTSNLPSVTSASKPTILGGIFFP
ncbi:MAG: anhydro-N-acetylmuramic acid kinase [Gammaproteobacteria bacterium]|nr:anhydro-N-acetylmuramic acid kinase [Gammaproteobacteria bacterium]